MSDNGRGPGALALGLGVFSVALGVWELTAPRRINKVTGLRSSTTLLRLCGLREIATGIGILAQHRNPGWLQARVAGDAMDLALLGSAFYRNRRAATKVGAAAAAVAGVTALDMYCAHKLSREGGEKGRFLRARRSITINKPAAELYRMWRDLASLPELMTHLEAVQVTGEKTSHWVVKGPAGISVEWDAEITEDLPDRLIAWRSVEGSTVEHTGAVRFEPAPGNRGTMLHVELFYRPPAGRAGAAIAKLLGRSPDHQITIDLFRLKQRLETGEIARTEGQPAARKTSISPKFDIPARA